MTIFTSACYCKFTFPTTISYSTLGIVVYLFYRKKVIAQFKNGGKMIGIHISSQENDISPLWCIKKKPASFNARLQIRYSKDKMI